jgi:hypothetical protein
MGPLGHFAVGLAAKPAAPKLPLGVLLLATEIPDILALTLGYAGVEGKAGGALPWSHGLFMCAVWSAVAALVSARIFRDYRGGVVVGLMVLSHWLLDFISHPIPFASFSWSKWQWDYGHSLLSDLPLLFSGSPTVGLGLYNRISAVAATVLEFAMFVVGAAVYARCIVQERRPQSM